MQTKAKGEPERKRDRQRAEDERRPHQPSFERGNGDSAGSLYFVAGGSLYLVALRRRSKCGVDGGRETCSLRCGRAAAKPIT